MNAKGIFLNKNLKNLRMSLYEIRKFNQTEYNFINKFKN